jgi:hypothetical protein
MEVYRDDSSAITTLWGVRKCKTFVDQNTHQTFATHDKDLDSAMLAATRAHLQCS